MPNRIIKESILTSQTMSQLTAEGERHFYRCLLLIDDHGCFESTPMVIKGRCYPYYEDLIVDDVARWNDEMRDTGITASWLDNGREYSMFLNFDKHNSKYAVTDDGKPTRHRRKTPEPPADILCQSLPALANLEQIEPKPNHKPNHNPDPVNSTTANFIKIYESNIGLLTPMIAEDLKDIEDTYSEEWFEEAVKEACVANARNLKYIRAILERWQTDGFKSGKRRNGRQEDRPHKRVNNLKGNDLNSRLARARNGDQDYRWWNPESLMRREMLREGIKPSEEVMGQLKEAFPKVHEELLELMK